jgi:hypothetical protein
MKAFATLVGVVREPKFINKVLSVCTTLFSQGCNGT